MILHDEYLGNDDKTKMCHTILAEELFDFHKKTHTYTTGKFINCVT